ncbi:MAG TPA: NAD(P)-dependent oxidoreductase [Stellaceae bacterium]|nr:NAD(P)-dependent oxidoreductase [Stellaceae bacterium]
MLPLFLDVSRLNLVLTGNGRAALRRMQLLDEAGARCITVFAPAPEPDLAAAAGSRLRRRWPKAADLDGTQLVFIAGPLSELRAALAAQARQAGAVVHVEDAPALSDAQAAAVLRRGTLTVAVSTGGASPALAVKMRDYLGDVIGPEWHDRVEQLSQQRSAWRQAGIATDRIAALTDEWLKCRGWLAAPGAPA